MPLAPFVKGEFLRYRRVGIAHRKESNCLPVGDCFQPETGILSIQAGHVEFVVGGRCPPYYMATDSFELGEGDPPFPFHPHLASPIVRLNSRRSQGGGTNECFISFTHALSTPPSCIPYITGCKGRPSVTIPRDCLLLPSHPYLIQ